MAHEEEPSFRNEKLPKHVIGPSDEVMDARIDRLIQTAGLVCIGSATVVVGDWFCDSVVGEGLAAKTAAVSGILWLVMSGRMKTLLESIDQPRLRRR